MNKVTEIKNSKDANLGLSTLNKIVKMETQDDRVYAYLNAETIVDSFMDRERDSAISLIRAEALMKEKRETMGDLWNANLGQVPEDMKEKWYHFLKQIGEFSKNRQTNSVDQLLRFANYNETAKLKGIKLVAPNQGQLTTLIPLMNKKRNKGTKPKGLIDVSIMYSELAKEYNDGKVFNSATDVKEAFEKYHEPKKIKQRRQEEKKEDHQEEKQEDKKIYVRHIFEEEAGDCPGAKYAPMEFPALVTKGMPTVTDEEWKHFVKKVSLAIHPDQGGTESDQTIFNSFREMMKVVKEQTKSIDARNQWEDDYDQWKKDNGYESDFVLESEVKDVL